MLQQLRLLQALAAPPFAGLVSLIMSLLVQEEASGAPQCTDSFRSASFAAWQASRTRQRSANALPLCNEHTRRRLAGHPGLVLPSTLYQEKEGPSQEQVEQHLIGLIQRDPASFLGK